MHSGRAVPQRAGKTRRARQDEKPQPPYTPSPLPRSLHESNYDGKPQQEFNLPDSHSTDGGATRNPESSAQKSSQHTRLKAEKPTNKLEKPSHKAESQSIVGDPPSTAAGSSTDIPENNGETRLDSPRKSSLPFRLIRQYWENSKMAATATAISPSHSPRLPSPPPFPEVQIGPQSPTSSLPPSTLNPDLEDTSKYDHAATRRIRPGTKAADMSYGPPLVPLHHTRPENANTTVPISRETAQIIAKAPEGVDQSLWLYELCRLLVKEANDLIVAFFEEKPPCSSQTCPEMRASEWQYLCAVHDPPKSCCAIDYCCHTMDWAANQLTSQKNFPSRLTLGHEGAGGSHQGIRVLTNVFRRVYRIFAHAWFQHRQVFWDVEGNKGLYMFFKTVCDVFNLIPQESYTIPPDAEGVATTPTSAREADNQETRPAQDPPKDESAKIEALEAATSISTGATTRRHKHTPSTGSAVTTIAEGDEEDKEHQSPDKDVPSDLLSNMSLKKAPTALLSKEPPGETNEESKAIQNEDVDQNAEPINNIETPSLEETPASKPNSNEVTTEEVSEELNEE
ncbi:MAG: hypothetical protein LQ342_003029 [Letrouitia transgressa]|nr:MAG: hypothetical protein LQ342_003029 [Letrouitia transgressa]